MLEWLTQFSIFCFLDNHQYDFLSPSFECLAGAGSFSILSPTSGMTALQTFTKDHDDWIFGHLSYDLKNEIEDLSSANPDHIQFPDIFFSFRRLY
jgi:para-aminobenzoate synthetase component 1